LWNDDNHPPSPGGEKGLKRPAGYRLASQWPPLLASSASGPFA